MSTSHSCPVAGSVTVKRADSGAVSSACTFQAGAERGGDVGHGRRVLGGDVEVPAGAVHEAVCPHGVSTGENQWIRGTERDHIRQEPRVQLRYLRHAAARVREASWGKASSHTARTVRPTRVRSTGHSWRSRSWSR